MTRVALATVLLLAGASQAKEIAGESARSMFLEVKLAPYTPLIDSAFTTTKGPYQETFGGTPMLLGEVELDYQFFQKVGSLAVGLSGGYAEKFAKAKDTTGAETSEATGFMVVPLKALLVYRFDWFSLKHDIPLVPYAKAAFVVMPWWGTKGGKLDSSDGVDAWGVSFGAAGVLGLALTLDFLDQRLARDFDTGVGVNHSYLFSEFTMQKMGLSGPNKIDLSSLHWSFGLGFEF